MMKKSCLISGILGLVAAIVYFASMADYAFPGESAGLIACWKGLEPAAHAPYPFMSVFARLLGGGNLIAPICGIIAVVTLFHLVRLCVSVRANSACANLAALTASVVFMVSPAVRSAATHLEPRMFDFTWALLIAALAIPFLRGVFGSVWLYPALAGAAVALGFADSVLFLTLAPLYLALVGLVARKGGQKPYLPILLFLLAGILTFLWETAAFGLNMGLFLRRAMAELATYYATPGWFFVFIFTTLPFLAVLTSGDDALEEKPGRAKWIFHGALTFVTILAVATPLSPSSLMEPYGRLPVATSAFAAVVAGYLVAFWSVNRRAMVALVAGCVLGLALAAGVLWNLFTFDGKVGEFADDVARKILGDMDGRRWLVTDGAIDSHIRLVAAEMGQDVNVLSLARNRDAKYLSELGEVVRREVVGGENNETLRMSLSQGVLPFIQAWFASDPSVARNVAVFAAPDVWYSAGFAPVPEFLFFGADEGRVPDWSDWKDFDRILKTPEGWGSSRNGRVLSPVDRLRLSLRRYLGLVANNRGVYLQEHGKDDEAFGMYELVLNEIDRDNVCALVNETGLALRKHPAARAKQSELDRRLKAASADRDLRNLLWRLGSTYGYIFDPDAFIRLGYAWAKSARPGDVLPRVRRRTPQDMLLGRDISRNDGANAERHAREILRKDPDAPLANYVMGSLALGRGRNAEAEKYLRKAADAREPVPLALNDLAEVLRRRKSYAEAERYARRCVECAPAMYIAWETLGSVLMDSGRSLDEAESAIRKACELSKGRDGKAVDVRMLVSLARVQLKNGDRAHAQVTIRKIQPRLGELSGFERAEFEKLLKNTH